MALEESEGQGLSRWPRRAEWRPRKEEREQCEEPLRVTDISYCFLTLDFISPRMLTQVEKKPTIFIKQIMHGTQH